MAQGKLIALECVNETLLEALVQRLYRWLGERGIAAEHTAEPTNGPVGAQIVLARQGRLHLDPLSLALYDLADRLDHLGRADGVLAWLSQGQTVLCARYLAFSYACHLAQVDLDWLRKINARCRVPDLTLFVDLEPDATTADLHGHYQAALAALRRDGQAVVVVDGRSGMDPVFERCCWHIAALRDGEG